MPLFKPKFSNGSAGGNCAFKWQSSTVSGEAAGRLVELVNRCKRSAQKTCFAVSPLTIISCNTFSLPDTTSYTA